MKDEDDFETKVIINQVKKLLKRVKKPKKKSNLARNIIIGVVSIAVILALVLFLKKKGYLKKLNIKFLK